MELTYATNEFLGSSSFTILALVCIFVMGIVLRLVFGPVERGY
jgi:hypothetical protein